MSGVFVRAKTSDDRWASVNAADLDEASFRRFVLRILAEIQVVASVPEDEGAREPLRTPLTKAQAEGE